MTFRRPEPRPAKQMDYTPKPREVVLRRDQPATLCAPLPKSKPWRCKAYLRLVASMPCVICGMSGNCQAAHADEGKGLAIKSDDRTCFPACADRPGWQGCHSLVGSTGTMTKQERREFEQRQGAATRARIKADGLWRPEWPEWAE